MAVTTEKCSEVRSLRAFAKALRGATDWWQSKYQSDSRCDKKNFAFMAGSPRDGLSAFSATVHLEAYAGYYGNSSVSRAISFDDKLIARFFAKALNQHKQAIFDSMAALAEEEAAKAVTEAREELAAIQALLDEAATDAAETVAATPA